MENSVKIIKEVGKEYGDITGRRYGLVEEYRTDGAEGLLIASGAMAQTAKDAVDVLRKRKKKIGLVRVRTFRPFPKEDLKKIMRNRKVIGVIDRNISLGNEGIFFQEIKSALYNEKQRPAIYGFIAGLGGRDVLVDEIIDIAENMSKRKFKKEMVWVGAKV